MIIAGTGHRPNKLGGYSKNSSLLLCSIAKEWIKCNDVTHIITGMALGWDLALAQAAIDLQIPFTSAIPFLGQESIWPQHQKNYYNYVLSKAKSIEYICAPGYASWKMQRRNEWMVDNSDIILAMWDGTEGGTYNCINYANDKNKEIINLFQQWKSNN